MNSLTVNNRVPQQRGTPLHGFPSFWYEGMVSGSDAPCNHRNAGSTVGDTVCICLTAGSGTGEGDMSTLFAGSRKPSALSTCEKGIPRSVLARCGNLRESSLSAKRQQCINPQNAARQTRKNSAPKGAVINQATCFKVNSKCMSSYGKITPFSPFSITPWVISFLISECTALTSRLTRRATSRIETSPSPVMDLIIAIRLGDSVSWSKSQLRNERKCPLVDSSPSVAAMNRELISSIVVTRTFSVVIVLPSVLSDISPEISKKLLDGSKRGRDLFVADVLVIAFSSLIVVTQDTGVINNVGQSVFVIVVTGSYCRINLPDNQFSPGVTGEGDYLSHDCFRWHRLNIASVHSVVNDSNTYGVLSIKATPHTRSNATPSTPARIRGQK